MYGADGMLSYGPAGMLGRSGLGGIHAAQEPLQAGLQQAAMLQNYYDAIGYANAQAQQNIAGAQPPIKTQPKIETQPPIPEPEEWSLEKAVEEIRMKPLELEAHEDFASKLQSR